jgi:hypothetical protein
VLTNVRQSHRNWRAGRARATIARRHHKQRPPVGTTLSFAVNEPATVKLTFTYANPRRRVHGRCVAKSRHNRRAPRCARQAGPLSFAVQSGTHRVRFDGVVSRKTKLGPGRYTVTIVAINSVRQSSKPSSLKFTIVK